MRHKELRLAFSISCTSRQPRGTEQNGVEYFFITPEEFRRRIDNGEFLEYEEVYKDRFYGTLKEQVERQSAQGDNVVFDVDVKGGCNIKKYYGSRALSIFIQPPSIDELRRRLEGRGTDAPEVIDDRIARAEFELTFAGQFDRVVVNDDLQKGPNFVDPLNENKELRDYRIREAEEMLTNCQDIPVGQVGELCGFTSPSAFHRAFVQSHDGLTPNRYRKQAEGK